MPEQYAHTLLADDLNFVPRPQQVAAFFDALVKIGAAPDRPQLRVMKLSGEVRSFTNPLTGKTTQIPRYTHIPLKQAAGIPQAIAGLMHYNVIMSGEGPPERPALEFEHKGMYEFLVSCCLRAESVSTSSWHEDIPISREVPFFDKPYSPADRTGFFQHADSDKVIKVANAGCGLFRIEFEYVDGCSRK